MDERPSSPDPVAGDEYYDLEKVTFLPGAVRDAVTFALQDEDHTLGNALRYIIMKNPLVEFCGYSAPHPSEPKIHLRIQMYDGHSATAALMKGLNDLEALTKTIQAAYEKELAEGNYERTVEPTSQERLAEFLRKKHSHSRDGGE